LFFLTDILTLVMFDTSQKKIHKRRRKSKPWLEQGTTLKIFLHLMVVQKAAKMLLRTC
jgi:hypothetical protein